MAENLYTGVKFITTLLGSEFADDIRLNDMKFWCKEFHEKKLAPPYPGGSCGNLSYRYKDNSNSFIITGSRIGLKNNLTKDSFVKVVTCDMKYDIVYALGKKEPSSESILHYSIYKKRKDVYAIFHGHSKEILDAAPKLNIITTKVSTNYGTKELIKSVLEVLNNNNFIIIKDHGFIALGKTIEEAGKLSLEMLNKSLNQ